MKTMLLSMAHPDDESFLVGGTVAKYAKAGWKIHLLCATRGEAGKSPMYENETDFGGLRVKELEEAAKILGIQSIIHLDCRDGKLSGLTPGELEEQVYKPMKEIAPDVVITFEPNGVTNHPDHIKLCTSTTFAFQKYAKTVVLGDDLGSRDPRRYLLTGDENDETQVEPRLYYGCIPESVSQFLMKQRGIPKVSFGKPWRAVPDKKITTVIDISRTESLKRKAISQHITQEEDIQRYFSVEHNPLLQHEYFILRMSGIHEVFMGNNDRIVNRL